MKFKTLLFLILSIFIVGMSNAKAASVVSDSDKSTLCSYSGASVDVFTAIPGVPSTIIIPYMEGSLTIEAAQDSDMFYANVKFRHFDKERVLTVIDIDDVIEYGSKLVTGTLKFEDLIDFAGNVNGSDSATVKGYIKNNFTVVSNSKDDVNPYLDKVTGTSSAITQGSINKQQDMANNGVCPDAASVELSYNAISKKFSIADVTFDSSTVLNNGFNNWVFTKISTLLLIPNDKTYVYSTLSTYRFADDAKYKSYDGKTCLNEADADYYIAQFNTISSYKSNSSYVRMFKNNGFDTIAKSIVIGYMNDGTCAKENPSLASKYSELRSAAQDALNAMNSTSESLPANECEYILGDPNKAGDFAYYLNITFRFIKFAAPILLICVTIFDYIKAISASDGDAIQKTNKKTLTRLIFTLLIFMLPIIINAILNLTGVQGTCGID